MEVVFFLRIQPWVNRHETHQHLGIFYLYCSNHRTSANLSGVCFYFCGGVFGTEWQQKHENHT